MCRGLTLIQPAPRRPAAYGVASDLTTTPSCPLRHRVAEERVRLLRVRRHQPRHQHLGRDDGGQRRPPLDVGQVDEVGPVQVQHVKQERRQRHGRIASPGPPAAAAVPVWLAARAAVS